MANKDEIENIIDKLKQIKPVDVFNFLNRANEGTLCLLSFLNDCEGFLTAGELSRAINVSTARIAVLLKNLEKKELIIRTNDDNDARKSIIGISPKGKELVENATKEICDIAGVLIDKIGFEKIEEFINISNDIKKYTEEYFEVRGGKTC